MQFRKDMLHESCAPESVLKSWKTTSLAIKWSLKTSGLWWQVQLHWNVEPSGRNVWSFKTGDLSRKGSLYTYSHKNNISFEIHTKIEPWELENANHANIRADLDSRMSILTSSTTGRGPSHMIKQNSEIMKTVKIKRMIQFLHLKAYHTQCTGWGRTQCTGWGTLYKIDTTYIYHGLACAEKGVWGA